MVECSARDLRRSQKHWRRPGFGDSRFIWAEAEAASATSLQLEHFLLQHKQQRQRESWSASFSSGKPAPVEAEAMEANVLQLHSSLLQLMRLQFHILPFYRANKFFLSLPSINCFAFGVLGASNATEIQKVSSHILLRCICFSRSRLAFDKAEAASMDAHSMKPSLLPVLVSSILQSQYINLFPSLH